MRNLVCWTFAHRWQECLVQSADLWRFWRCRRCGESSPALRVLLGSPAQIPDGTWTFWCGVADRLLYAKPTEVR